MEVSSLSAAHARADAWTGVPADHQRDRRRTSKPTRSPNRVKSKPADPAILSSIISSLDTLPPLPDITPPADHFSETASQHSRAESSKRSVASSASIHKPYLSPGFGVEYGVGLELDDVDGLTDAALPPTIPTSRPPSGLSHYKSPASAKKPSTASTFRNKPSSRKSSFSAASVDRPASTRNKLSSESWVRRKNSFGGDESIASPRGRSPRKGRLRRVGSHEILRADSVTLVSGQVDVNAHEKTAPLSLAEQIIAKSTPPLSASKGRLFLRDSTINEAQPLVEPSPPAPSPLAFEVNPLDRGSKASESKASSEKQLSVSGTPPLKSPSPIQDSIPMRTSSLRQSSSSPAGRRKNRKSKRHTLTSIKSETMQCRPSKSIPDSSWADLGDDDETVRRIKELREQRKSRLQDSFSFYPSSVKAPLSSGEKSDSQHTPVYELSAPPAKEAKRTSRTRPSANRQATNPTKAHKTLGLKGEKAPHLSNGTDVKVTRPVSEFPDPSRQLQYSLEVKRPLSTQYRPTSARSAENSPILPLSLDYSYAKAVDLLQTGDLGKALDKERREREISERKASLGFKRTDFQTPEKPTTLAVPLQTNSSTKKKRSPQERWTAHHPDIPLAFDKRKNRRKSMSDARFARANAEEQETARRDSIEEAVEEYLRASRLNRIVRNIATGRTIAFSEVGDPNGAAVFVCVGMGLTRYVTAFYDELATTLRLRLITVDRPGVGGSDPYPVTDKSGPLGWPEDVLEICQHLGIVKFSILAHSAGAVYALATALILPHLIKGKIHLLAPWVPPSQLEAISHPAASAPPANPLPRSQRLLRVLPTPFLKAANSSFMSATSASLKPASKRNVKASGNKSSPRRATNPDELQQPKPSSRDRPEYHRRESMMLMDQFMPETTPLDNFPIPIREEENESALRRGSLILSATATPMDPGFQHASTGLNAAEHTEKERQSEYTAVLTQRTWDMATRDSNPATDLLVCLERNRDVGFRYTDVACDLVVTHGSEDKRVPVANVKWLAEQMNRRALGMNLRDERASGESCVSNNKGGCEVRILEGEGHGLMASPIIMADVLTEIAGYWPLGHDRGRL